MSEEEFVRQWTSKDGGALCWGGHRGSFVAYRRSGCRRRRYREGRTTRASSSRSSARCRCWARRPRPRPPPSDPPNFLHSQPSGAPPSVPRETSGRRRRHEAPPLPAAALVPGGRSRAPTRRRARGRRVSGRGTSWPCVSRFLPNLSFLFQRQNLAPNRSHRATSTLLNRARPEAAPRPWRAHP